MSKKKTAKRSGAKRDRAPIKPAKTGPKDRNEKGRFAPGNRANPNGRKPKALATVEKLRTALADELPGIIKAVVAKARDGDIAASKLILERVLPPLKAAEATVVLDALTGTRTEQGQSILHNMAAGALSPSQAAQLLGALVAQARLAEVDELEQRLTEIEKRIGDRSST